MDFTFGLSESDLAFIIVFYIYLLGASIVSVVLVSIYTKLETRKSWKEIFKEI